MRDKIQRILEILTAFFFLNMLWIIFCLPIITIFPSTMTMFSIVRRWKLNEIDYDVAKLFFSEFKENARKYFMLGVVWLIFGILLIIDYFFIITIQFEARNLLFGLLFLGTFMYLGMSLFIFGIAVNFDLPKKAIFKNALLYTIGKLGTTVLTVMILVSMVIICYIVPYLLWIIGSITAFFIYTTMSNMNRVSWEKDSSQK
ncbi:putative membrane protein YesL [Metabacillus crassostreae]|uniref:YesL family protein n=1 Tax=Metabacillus crassostreae TaxID=929098 RepID=UPI00195C63E7|nr:YesL family protein [Metabacillus crassostreae]MBM7605290.1 putative membrane protein YesL [Metabacillus crassostreae]